MLTPKSLLRHPRVTSPLEELGAGRFRRVLPDTTVDRAKARRILLCMGKVYWDLVDKREELGVDDIAIIRLEQLAPFPWSGLRAALEGYAEGTPAIWVQEEPRNMGAWHYLKLKTLREGPKLLDRYPLYGLTRPVSASPATGSSVVHKREQAELVERAFLAKAEL